MIEYPSLVRIATPADEAEVMKRCCELHQENGLFSIDTEKVQGVVSRAVKQEGGILGVIGPSDRLEGLILLMISNYWYSSQYYLEELFVYVHPDFRKSRNAAELTTFAKWCAASAGLPLLIGVMSRTRVDGKTRLYRRQFGRPLGNLFYFDGEAGAPESFDVSALSSEAVGCLKQLFTEGPIKDHKVASKGGCRELVDQGLVFRAEGFTALTEDGLSVLVELNQRDGRAKVA